jgi:zinc/manganese transport system substrate-binding protein
MAPTLSKERIVKKSMLGFLLTLVGFALAAPAFAALNVFACEPEWAALTQELGGDKADIYSATTALQDPHQIQARPSLIARARRAQLLVCTGAELEIGWLPVILNESGNPEIAPGKPGHFEAARYVTMLEVPTQLDRAEGDVHAAGNPHIQLDARNFVPIAKALSQRLAEIDPANAAYYQTRLQDFTQRWQAAVMRWEKLAAPLRGQAIVVHHKSFAYLNHWLGLVEVATLEPKPGMQPSVAHMSDVLQQLQRSPARMVVRAAYQSPQASQWLAERAHIPMVVVPFSVGGTDGAKDLFGLFDDTIARLLAGLK